MASRSNVSGAAETTILPPAAPQMSQDQTTRVYEIDPLRDSRWTELVRRHPHGSVFHSPSWLNSLLVTYGYVPVVISTCAANVPLTNGLVFCRVESWLTGHRYVSVPFSDHCEPLVDGTDQLDCLLSHLKQKVDSGGGKYVEIRPILCVPGIGTGLSVCLSYELHRLALRKTAEQLFRNFHKTCVQSKIRRAERENLQYEEGTSEELLHKFYRLLTMTRRRQFLPPQPIIWFRALIGSFGKDLKIRVATKDGRAVASILTISYKNSMIYKYGCSNAAFNKLGGTALLFWRAIQEARNRGFDEFEMGRSDLDNRGLITFKEHWGAKPKNISYWNYPPGCAGLPSLWKQNLAKRMVPILPDLALKTIGSLLYKHIA
jgi:CelD/BcsL family acetyltransferase involved in cellulose biosynthesis